MKCIALSCDPVDSHKEWIKDIQATSMDTSSNISLTFNYPIISDPDRVYAIKLGMLDPVAKDRIGLPLTARAVCEHIQLIRHYITVCLCNTGVYCRTR